MVYLMNFQITYTFIYQKHYFIHFYCLLLSSVFLKTGVVFICFKTDENLGFLTLKLQCRNSANMSAFSLITLVGTLVSWHVLDMPKFKISPSTFSLHTSKIEKGLADLFLDTSTIVSIFRNFKISYNAREEIVQRLSNITVF